ncbi:MAG: hypothetical protein OXC82_13310 [Rhodobacteraceae bacterium]|nr:hypothetical protein [Paracoccaceae bacterium]
MKVLLSIKPIFAERIFDGTKGFEFRKKIFIRSGIKHVIVYASAPISRVIGEFEIEEILKDSPVKLWKKTQQQAGISEKEFFSYFEERNVGYAIKVKHSYRYPKPEILWNRFLIHPPQSFCYVT